MLLSAIGFASLAHTQEPVKVSVDWNTVVSVSKTVPTLQVIPNALMRRGQPLHEVTFSALKALDTKYVRYLPWGPYPRLQVAALEPPSSTKTSWDFSHIDPEAIDFLEATQGREPIINFSAVPAWMQEGQGPIRYSENPDQMAWKTFYLCAEKPLPLKDRTGKQLADYFARIASWYTKGGFTDENGKYHHSGHHYELPWWGVLNEYGHLGPEQYTVVYDAIVSAIRKVSPRTRFLGLELADTAFPTAATPQFFEYFLNPKNHQPGIPLDMISYHFYVWPRASETAEHWQYTFFDQADAFLAQVNFIESIRKRLTPSTRVYLTELGTMLPADELYCSEDQAPAKPIPPEYWNVSAALYAYLYTELAKRGIDAAGQAGFLFYPGNFPSVTMMDWKSGKLNARFHVLKLMKDHFGPGDELKSTTSSSADVAAQAFETTRGKRLLLINKRNRHVEVELGARQQQIRVDIVDQNSGEKPARVESVEGSRLRLEPFAVAVAEIKG